jgi:phospholipase C
MRLVSDRTGGSRRCGVRLHLVGETRKFGRRTLLGGALVAGTAAAAAGALDGDKIAYAATTEAGMAPSGALGLGAGGRLLQPDSLPHPRLPAGTDTIPQIEHVVVLMMENHSFDDHFGMLGRGDGLTLGPRGHALNFNPGPDDDFILSYPLPNTAVPIDSNISQSWDQSHLCWADGTNQGFAQNCGPASMGYFSNDQLPFYYSLAGQFPIGDRYFCSVMAQTYPNRRFLIAGTALGDVSTGASGISSVDAPNGTIFDRFDTYGITWRDYYPDIPTAALFLPNYLDNTTNGKMAPINQFLTDAAAGQLPQFSLVDPYVDYSEESGDVSIGEAYAARIIGAVLDSPDWATTAMILVWDEHGGWYDHVPPVPAIRPDDVPPEITVPPDQSGAYDYTGFRVPCVVISPYAKQNFVSRTVYDHTSILKFVETKWNLPAMTYRDANAADMLDFLDVHRKRPPFADPPEVSAPLNPFVGPLPASSSAPGFHPIAVGVEASTLPPAHYRRKRPPKEGGLLSAGHGTQGVQP